jgi:hypothetical protein
MSFHPTPAQSPTSVDDVMDAQEGLSKITIADSTLSWSDNEDKVGRRPPLRPRITDQSRLLGSIASRKPSSVTAVCCTATTSSSTTVCLPSRIREHHTNTYQTSFWAATKTKAHSALLLSARKMGLSRSFAPSRASAPSRPLEL